MRRLTACLFAILLILSFGICAYADNESSFKISFLDVGEGDAALVSCDGYTLLIDGGPSDKSDYIYTFLKNNNIDRIDYIVATHADADHIGGLSGALNYATVGVVLCPVKENDTKQFESFVKYLEKQNNQIVIPNAGDRFSLGNAKVEVLYPEKGEAAGDNTSIALKILYGDTSFLFTGDNEIEDEDKMLNLETDLSATVLKIGHHGSASSTSDEFLEKVNPEYAVISVGDNTYGHPSDTVTEKLNRKNIRIYRTDTNGIITCSSDGKNVAFSVEKQLSITKEFTPFAMQGEDTSENNEVTKQIKDEEDKSFDAVSTDYIANTSTKKFHIPSCSSVKKMSEKNKWYYSGTRDELIQSGYSPCKNCNP